MDFFLEREKRGMGSLRALLTLLKDGWVLFDNVYFDHKLNSSPNIYIRDMYLVKCASYLFSVYAYTAVYEWLREPL